MVASQHKGPPRSGSGTFLLTPSQRRFKARFKSQVSSYSHINIQRAPEADSEVEKPVKPEDFIRKDSVQTEIDDNLLYSARGRLFSPKSRPRTFAEAAMSTRRTRTDTTGDGSDPSVARPMSLESLGPFRYTFKKKKKTPKWAPLEFGARATDSASEGGSVSDMGGVPLSSAVSRSPQVSSASSSTLTSTSSSFPTTAISTSVSSSFTTDSDPSTPTAASFQGIARSVVTVTTPDNITRRVLESPASPIDTDPTPTQERFHLAALGLAGRGDDSLDQYRPLRADSRASDTESTKARTDKAMAGLVRSFSGSQAPKPRGHDHFDSLEWDPDLPGGSTADGSPEQITVTPQPLAYTTVGSIVDPNAVPQFTAPNRIQREGSGRRALLPLMQGRHHDSLLQNRGLSPSLNMQGSMQYAQQLAHSPGHLGFSSHTPPSNSVRSSQSSRSLQKLASLTDQDGSTHPQAHGSVVPRMFSGNHIGSPATPTPSNKPSSTATDTIHSTLGDRDLASEEGRTTSLHGPVQGPVQGLEKMQTLQRLAKFDNPMQNLALSRLSEFSVAKSKGTPTTFQNPILAAEAPSQAKNPASAVTSSRPSVSLRHAGELDREYRFPPQGFPSSAAVQTNPLFGAFSSSTREPSKVSAAHRGGYPAPLTAGPPGQRQFQGVPNKLNFDQADNFWASAPQSSAFSPYTSATTQINTSPWYNTQNLAANHTFGHGSIVPTHDGGGCNSTLVDTVPMPVASKYYPRGLPGDMTGVVTPLPYHTRKQMGQIPGDFEPQNAEEKALKKAEELDNWFYDGQRRFVTMSAVDHVRDHEERKLASTNPFGPIGPPPKKALPPTRATPLTIEDINKMTISDAAGPILDAAFGTFLSYTSDAGKALSKVEASPAWQIDDTVSGNVSYYGEDWGPPPKRTSHDDTY